MTDTFFKNVPEIKDSIIPEAFRSLEPYDKPHIIFVGTNSLPLEDINFSQESVDHINKKGLDVIISEPLGLRHKESDDHNFGHYSEFPSHVKVEDLISDELESLEEFAYRNSINEIRVLCREKGIEKIQKNYSRVRPIYYIVNENLEDNYSKIGTPEKREIEKTFASVTNRFTCDRFLTMSFLAQKSGNFGWPFEANFEVIENSVWFDREKFPSKRLKNCKKNVKLLNDQKLKKKYYNIDLPRKRLKVRYPYEFAQVKRQHNRSHNFFNNKFKDIFSNSFLFVVNETRFAQPLPIITEKMVYPLLFGWPFVVIAPPNTLKHLREDRGHKTFSDFWNESYDQEENHSKRINMVFDLLEQIESMSKNQQEEMYNEMKPILEHNRKVPFTKFPNPHEDLKYL